MPHFLVHGAFERDGVAVTRVFFADDEGLARAAANSSGMAVARMAALDSYVPRPRDAGQASALSRLATALNRAKRTDDAIAVMEQVYEMREQADEGATLCFRIPRYLLKAGRRDEAWRYLQRMRGGRAVGNSIGTNRVPAEFSAFFEMSARVIRADGRENHAKLYDAAASIAHVVSEFWIASDGVAERGVADRRDAIEQVAAIAAEVLGTQEQALEGWAASLIGNDERVSFEAAVTAASNAYAALLGRVGARD